MAEYGTPLSNSTQGLLRALQNANSQSVYWREQLATDSRINRAGDGPAASSSLERFSLQNRGSVVAAQNISQATNLTQTVDEGLQNALEVAQKMRETTLSALNGTNNPADLRALDENFQALRSDLTFIKNSTRFNNIDLFTDRTVTFQVGYARGDRLDIELQSYSFSDTAEAVWDAGGYTWLGEGGGGGGPYNPTMVDSWYAALGLDPAQFFPRVGANINVAQTDLSRAMTEATYNAVLAAANDGSSGSLRSLTFQNASFEEQALGDGKYTNNSLSGWAIGNAGSYTAGAYNPKSKYIDESTVDGVNVAYIYQDGGSISQTLGELYDADSVYEITVALGDLVAG